MALKIEVSSVELNKIIVKYLTYPMDTFPSYQHKLEHFYMLSKLVNEDEELNTSKIKAWLE
ncbi:hypothetical protein [Muriicola sp. Z0-33]|uniref:hypothetical protein n=1 Tax=Muriicola sp. Z0-33 TaxID=2816957 RepID=UPI002237E47B|nr:hypothetical protein [Muriicola sp. Z0-33]